MRRSLKAIAFLVFVLSACEKSKPVTHTIVISQMRFNPSEVEVKLNDSVLFINNDIVVHDVTEATQKKWTSSPLAAGSSWTMIAKENADFYCTIHPMMKGKIKLRR